MICVFSPAAAGEIAESSRGEGVRPPPPAVGETLKPPVSHYREMGHPWGGTIWEQPERRKRTR
jgi:hypothetical protein